MYRNIYIYTKIKIILVIIVRWSYDNKTCKHLDMVAK